MGLVKHIHDDQVAGLAVHHKAEHVSSHLIGIEVHGVITRIELICAERTKEGRISMLDRRVKLSFDFYITLLEELSQCLFDYLALCM